MRWLPASFETRFRLEDVPGPPLRVELGSGPWPTAGYVHVDANRWSDHLEFVAPVWRLPFANGSVVELLAIHVLEHVHPSRVRDTLAEWRRVVASSGTVRVHVPNTIAILAAFRSATFEEKWALSGALLGMGLPAAALDPDDYTDVSARADHQVIYDYAMLEQLFNDAGFRDVTNVTGHVVDRHTEAWGYLVRDLSLVVEAR